MKRGDLVTNSDNGSGPVGVVVELFTWHDELLGRDYPAAKVLIEDRVLSYRISELWAFYEDR